MPIPIRSSLSKQSRASFLLIPILRFYGLLRKKVRAVESAVLRGGFAISTAFFDGELWCSCGEMRGKTWCGEAGFRVPYFFHFFPCFFSPIFPITPPPPSPSPRP